MLKDWLRKQLPPAKAESEMWSGYVALLQELAETHVEPLLLRIDNRKSLFTMAEEDLDTRMAELGQFFQIRASNTANKPILLAQRTDEIHFKGTDRPIVATFWREFNNLPARWEPLYAPSDVDQFPYGTYFTTADGVPYAKHTYGEFFLTSRGKITLSINVLYNMYGAERPDELLRRLQEEFEGIVEPLLPLDIVMDGFLMYLEFEVEELSDQITLTNVITTLNFEPIVVRGDTISTFSTKIMLPLIALEPGVRVMEDVAQRFDLQPLDSWRQDAVIRPPILPGVPSADTRMVIDANSTAIEVQGAREIAVDYSTGETEYYDTTGQTVMTLQIPRSRAEQITAIFYTFN